MTQVAVTLVRAIYATRSTLGDFESIDKLFQIIVPIIRDPEPTSDGGAEGAEGVAAGVTDEDGENKETTSQEEQVGWHVRSANTQNTSHHLISSRV